MKERLDILLVKKGLAVSREQAKRAIMSGNVFVKGHREDKASASFEEDVFAEIRGEPEKYVSRGGKKLEKAVEKFHLCLEEKICMDVGASTGGFTDCMLQNGAKKVYAVDVGYDQLAWKLRQDRRVVCMEKTNIRYVTGEQVKEPVEFASVDVSFISLTKVLPPLCELMTAQGEVVCLIKPQFEAGREKVGKKGVVRDRSVHLEVVNNIIDFARGINLTPMGLDYSPIKGPEGNIEYLLYLKKGALAKANGFCQDPKEVVAESHAQLD